MTLNAERPTLTIVSVTDAAPIDPTIDQKICDTHDTRDLVRDIMTRIADKWTMYVIRRLSSGPMRFTELQASIPGISHRMLTRTLRTLERDGLVNRTTYAQVPPRVDYELTRLGATLRKPVMAIVEWVDAHQSEIEANRAEFDAR